MEKLESRHCTPCKAGAPPLAPGEIYIFSQNIHGWTIVADHHLEKEYSFRDFRTALGFVNGIGEIAERAAALTARGVQPCLAVILVAVAAVYGGYFGVAMSVVVLMVLGWIIRDTLTRLNALKQVVAFGANGAAAVLFLFSGKVVWPIAVVMAVGALIGGTLGGRLAVRIHPETLRWTVVALGVLLSFVYFLRWNIAS